MSSYDTIIVKVGIPVQVKGEGALEMSHFNYPITLKLPEFDRERVFHRRYNDFDSLRNQLCATYWACIVPPIPEKESAADQISKIAPLGNKTDISDTLEYRRTALRRFLMRVAHHPTLGHSPLLINFTEDNTWRQCMQNPIKPPKFILLSLTDGIAKTFVSNTITREVAGTAFNRATRPEATDIGTWEAARAFVAYMDADLKKLRERFQSLVHKRKATSIAMNEFGAALGMLAESSINTDNNNMESKENAANEAGLRQAMTMMQQRSGVIGQAYGDHAEKELSRVVSTLGYYVGMCDAVQETMQHISNAHQYLETLHKRLRETESTLNRTGTGVTNNNMNSMNNNNNNDNNVIGGINNNNNNDLRANVFAMNEQRQRLEPELKAADNTFKEEFVQFHRNKEYDMKELLKNFGELEVSFADHLRREWNSLKQNVEELMAETYMK